MIVFIYLLILVFFILIMRKLELFKLKIELNCGFFLFLWWFYYFVMKIPYFIFYENYDYGTLLETLNLVFVFVVMFYLGLFFKPLNIKFSSFSKVDAFNFRFVNVVIFSIITLSIFVLFNYYKYGTLSVIESVGGLSERRDSTAWGGVGVYIVYFFSSFFKLCGMFALSYFIFHKKYFISFLFLVCFFLLSLQSGSKYALLWLIYPIAIFSYFRVKINVLSMVIPLSIVVISIPFINIYRNRGEMNLSANDANLMLDVLMARADLFNGLYNLVEHLHGKNTYELGLTIYSIFTRFIPRDFLPDRLGSSDTYMTKEIYNTSNWVFNYGGIGEFYFNFGVFGVAFIALLSGFIIKSVNYSLRISSKENLFRFSILLSCPVWSVGWGIGFNNLFTTLFMFWLITIPFSYLLLKFLCRKIV